MNRVDRVLARIGRAAEHHDPRGLPLAFGRSALAAAQLAVLAANSDRVLFHSTVTWDCDGVRAPGLWCLTGTAGPGAVLARAVAVVVLVAVLVGFRPRWTCVPHWYVAFSFAADATATNGGDRVTQVATALLVPLCLGDDRVWQWGAVRGPLPPHWRGAALAGLLGIRVQLCLMYLAAAVSKLGDPEWRRGTALHLVLHDPDYGASASVRDALGPVLGSYWLMALATWAVIAAQLVLAVTVLGGPAARRAALVLGTALHVAIGVVLNLPAFGLAVIALLVVGCAAPGSGGPVEGEREGGARWWAAQGWVSRWVASRWSRSTRDGPGRRS
ncbi:hypothetical protein [Saccharothrix syringae]|uniref:HTTM-like domain-containing protein n=1 Tax=Saccharothrix syringae TaxID=103733 RepID=A0A5Q0H5Q0_SACSY|nr:hypothetical protein [Saccharothrix syringae]QFZ21313.1 hypothetical protein EKG83_31490 [Saccharothrix syringae]